MILFELLLKWNYFVLIIVPELVQKRFKMQRNKIKCLKYCLMKNTDNKYLFKLLEIRTYWQDEKDLKKSII